MAELDPNIILGAGQINDPGQMLSLRAMAQQLKAGEQKQAQQNALRQMLAKPGAIDPATGMPSAETIGAIAQTGDVTTAATLADKQSEIAKRSQETQLKKLDLWKEHAGGPAQVAYEQAIERGVPEPEARQVGESVLNEGLDSLASTGTFSEEDKGKFIRQFDPTQNASRLETYDKFKDRQLDEKKYNEQIRRDDMRAAAAAAREDRMLAAFQFKQDQNAAPGEDDPAIIKAANYEIDPQSLLSRGTPAQRRDTLNAMIKVNPDFDQTHYSEKKKAVDAFGTGKQGDTTRSLNVSVAHLETLRELGHALENGDVKLVNAARQHFAEQFGVAAPTNFDTAKAIVADEVAKGVIGGQTAQSDRETLAASLKRSGGPKVIEGAINTFQSLLGGQLKGLESQYTRATGLKNFRSKFLLPETQKALTGDEKPLPVTLPDAAKAALKEGQVTTFKNGQRWMLQAGKPVQMP